MTFEFKFPDVGEGITEGEVVKWLVKEGDKVKENDDIVKIETDKAVIDIPSPKSGTILKIHFKDGDTIKVGETLVTIGTEGEKVSQAPKKKKSVSVIGELEEAPEKIIKKPVEETPKVSKPSETVSTTEVKVKALPRVRNLARKLGVDISKIKPTGENNTITEDDIINASKSTPQTTTQQPTQSKIKVSKKYDMWGYLDRIPLKGTRKTIARNMMKASQSVAAATAMDNIDVTKLWSLRQKEKIQAEKQKIKLTFFPYIIKAVIEALKKHPYLNATLTEEEIITKKYYSIGIAVDTEAGLIVPVLKRAETKSLYDIAKEIVELATKTRARKADIMDLKGGSFTITNYGSIGGLYGTPIINPPETAILGLGRIFDNQNNKILPISLTFDHRIIDGAEAARFLNTLKEYLESPEKIPKEGDK